MPGLDDYFDAYDRAHSQSSRSPAWPALRAGIRRSLLRPYLELASVVLLLGASIFLGLRGHTSGWFLAAGFGLSLLPKRLRELRGSVDQVLALQGTEELQRQLHEEADSRCSRALATFLLNGAFALLFLLTGCIAALLGKDWIPGLSAAGVMAGLAAFEVFYRLPRAAREAASYGLDDEGEDGDER